MDMLVYTARTVVPVASPPVTDGAVAVEDGRIEAVGPRADVLQQAPGAEVRDLGDVVVVPGLVNAHTHLELSWLGDDRPEGGDYVTWLRALMGRRDGGDEERGWQAAEQAVEAMARRGTVAVGEVANEVWTTSILARSSLHAVVFHELYGFPLNLAERLLAEAASRLDAIDADSDVAEAAGRIRVVLTPHAAHSTSAPLIKALAGRSKAVGDPLSIHVAESEAEIRFLRDGSGPFRDFLVERDAWEESWQPPDHPPLEHLDRLGALGPRTLAVHCVQVGQPELSLLQAREVTVVTCPRSNRYLDVGTAPVSRMLSAGIPVALGTDSLASAPDLDLFGELHALCELHESLAPAAALRMATLNGARALNLHDRLGSIEPGKLAELVVVPSAADGIEALKALVCLPEAVYRLADAPYEGGTAAAVTPVAAENDDDEPDA
jgi:cytosine/adenosine deaminase-related metal-dependent hydrolase